MNRFLLFLFLSVFTFSSSYASIDAGDKGIVVSEIQKEKESLSVLTNPVKNGYLKLQFKNTSSSSMKITIINSLGKQVYTAQRDLRNNSQTFDVSDLAAGIYFLRVNTTQSNFVKKLIIQ